MCATVHVSIYAYVHVGVSRAYIYVGL